MADFQTLNQTGASSGSFQDYPGYTWTSSIVMRIQIFRKFRSSLVVFARAGTICRFWRQWLTRPTRAARGPAHEWQQRPQREPEAELEQERAHDEAKSITNRLHAARADPGDGDDRNALGVAVWHAAGAFKARGEARRRASPVALGQYPLDLVGQDLESAAAANGIAAGAFLGQHWEMWQVSQDTIEFYCIGTSDSLDPPIAPDSVRSTWDWFRRRMGGGMCCAADHQHLLSPQEVTPDEENSLPQLSQLALLLLRRHPVERRLGFDAAGGPPAGGGAGRSDDSDVGRFAGAEYHASRCFRRVPYGSGIHLNRNNDWRDWDNGRNRCNWRNGGTGATVAERAEVGDENPHRSSRNNLIVTMCICFLLAGMVLVFLPVDAGGGDRQCQSGGIRVGFGIERGGEQFALAIIEQRRTRCI